MSRLQNKSIANDCDFSPSNDIGLDDLDIGPPISKGCSAVVYAASVRKSNKDTKPNNATTSDRDELSMEQPHQDSIMPIESPTHLIHNFSYNQDDPCTLSDRPLGIKQMCEQEMHRRVHFTSKMEVDTGLSVDKSLNENRAHNPMETVSVDNINEKIEQYPLALKMMFNYDVRSNAMAILRAMYKETIPIIHKYKNLDADGWERTLWEQTINLPSHPNIVMMVGVFCAAIPNLMQSTSLYPMAMPTRLNPYGYGRNMSLFLLMKRYSHNLCEYLKQITAVDSTLRTRLLLFAQLLEGVAHLYRHGVAHRDLKSDNILIDINNNDRFPILALSDFGCCIADKYNGLCIPYPSMDIDKGGNAALMAPEIITKNPGTFSILNYSKSDLWACGAIAYEIFGEPNPFYSNENTNNMMQPGGDNVLKSFTYKDSDLPPLKPLIPLVVKKLIANILQRNPNKRLSPVVAANVMQLFLWAPSAWLQTSATVSSPEILQWLLSLTAKVLYEGNLGNIEGFDPSRPLQSNRTYIEYFMLTSFLIRAQLQHIRNALEWIRLQYNVNN